MKNKKRILMMAGSIFVVVIVAVVVYFLVRQDSKDPAFSPDLDENAIVQTDGIKEKPEGIRIPGYPRITISADTKDVTMNLQNPEGNPCYFTFEIILTEGEETIYTSKLVEPGKAITDVTLSRALEKGESGRDQNYDNIFNRWKCNERGRCGNRSHCTIKGGKR